MFKLFNSRPPIIIINEAEHKEVSPPVVVEKTWWEKYAPVVFMIIAGLHFLALVFIVSLLMSLNHTAKQTNVSLVRQLRSGDSIYRASMAMHYNDSVAHDKNDRLRDSITAVSFQNIASQIQQIKRKNKILENRYRKAIESAVSNSRAVH